MYVSGVAPMQPRTNITITYERDKQTPNLFFPDAISLPFIPNLMADLGLCSLLTCKPQIRPKSFLAFRSYPSMCGTVPANEVEPSSIVI